MNSPNKVLAYDLISDELTDSSLFLFRIQNTSLNEVMKMSEKIWGIELYANKMTQEEANALNEKIKEILYEQDIREWSIRTGFGIKIPEKLTQQGSQT